VIKGRNADQQPNQIDYLLEFTIPLYIALAMPPHGHTFPQELPILPVGAQKFVSKNQHTSFLEKNILSR
jgi:hypothetical protein